MRIAILCAAGVAIAGAVALATPAKSHDWYDQACCHATHHGGDCKPIEDDAVEITPKGWRVKETGEVVPYADTRERKSKDSQFHRCSPSYKNPNAMNYTRCLYVPGMGS